jgi:pentatricopeptide repeat protein
MVGQPARRLVPAALRGDDADNAPICARLARGEANVRLKHVMAVTTRCIDRLDDVASAWRLIDNVIEAQDPALGPPMVDQGVALALLHAYDRAGRLGTLQENDRLRALPGLVAQPSSRVCAIAIRAWLASGHREPAIECFDRHMQELREHRYQRLPGFTIGVFDSMIEAFGETGRFDRAAACFAEAQAREAAGQGQPRRGGPKFRMDTSTYNNFLAACAAARRPAEARQCFLELLRAAREGARARPNQATYLRLMQVFAAAGDADSALQCLAHFPENARLHPGVATALFLACCNGTGEQAAQRLPTAIRCMSDMLLRAQQAPDAVKGKALRPRVETYTAMMLLCAKAGQARLAMDYYDEMVDIAGHPPDPAILARVQSALGRDAGVERESPTGHPNFYR